MIWSEQELANMSVAGAEVVKGRFWAHIDEAENRDVFGLAYFSYLWGILGLTGVMKIKEQTAVLLWKSLLENGVMQAFKAGRLFDFNQKLDKECGDRRLKAWKNIDIYHTNQLFKSLILSRILKYAPALETEILPYLTDDEDFLKSLVKLPISSALKWCLEYFRTIDCHTKTEEKNIHAIYCKQNLLKKISETITYFNKTILEEDKNYLFYYFHDALKDGYLPENIGFDDRFAAKLVADGQSKDFSALDLQPFLTRHQDLIEMIEQYDTTWGFFDETAAKLCSFDTAEIDHLTDRCKKLAEIQNKPKGIMFVLSLLNRLRIKSAVVILDALGKKGQATEMACFMHRLLPKVKGAESVVLQILKNNFAHISKNEVLCRQSAYMEYVFKVYFQATQVFANNGYFKESIELFNLFIENDCFSDDELLAEKFRQLANFILEQDQSMSAQLVEIAKKLRLSGYDVDGKIVIGTADSNPLTMMRKKIQQDIKATTTLDVSGVMDKMTQVESVAFNTYQNLKGMFRKDKPLMDEEKEEVLPSVEKTEENVSLLQNEKTDIDRDNLSEVSVSLQDGATDSNIEENVGNIVEENVGNSVEENADSVEENADSVVEQSEKSDIPQEQEYISTPILSNDELLQEATDILKENEIHQRDVNNNNQIDCNINLLDENYKQVIVDDFDALYFQDKDEQQNPKVTETKTEPVIQQVNETEAVVQQTDEQQNPKATETKTEPVIQQVNETEAVVQQTDELQNPKVTPTETEAVNNQIQQIFSADIKEWSDSSLNQQKEEGNPEKVKVSKILNINPKEAEKYFEKVKDLTSQTVQRAEESVAKIKEQVKNTQITQSSSVKKISKIAEKLKFFKKKKSEE